MNKTTALNDARITLASLPLVAQGLAGKAGVTVIIDRNAPTASTDGTTIRLPAMPLPDNEHDLDAAKKLATLAYGFIPHEIGHIRFTDLNVFRTFAKNGPAHRYLLNVLEDPRIEQAQIRDYPGNRLHLDRMLELMIEKGSFPAVTSEFSPDQALSSYCLYYLRATVRGTDAFRDLCNASRPAVVELLGESFVTRLDALLANKGKQLSSTKEAASLASAILKAAKQAAQEPPKPKTPPQGQPTQQQGQGDDDSDSSQEPGGDDQDSDGDDSSDQSGSGDDSDQGSDSAPGGDDGADADGQDGDGGGDPDPQDVQDQRQRQALQEILDGNGGGSAMPDLGEMLADEMSQTAKQYDHGQEKVADDAEVIRQLKQGRDGEAPIGGSFNADGALSASSKLRAVLQNSIQAMTLQRTSESVRGQKLNRRRLSRTSSGNRRIFLHEEERKGLDTAVFVLCDISGSMSGTKIEIASQAVYAAATAMSQLSGVNCAVGVFPVYGMVSQFGENPRGNPEKFALRATGGTPLAEGLMWAARKLAVRREARKILLVATDGDPDSITAARVQVEALTRRGFEVMGLGIELPSVRNVFEKHCVIQNVDEMPKALLGMLRNTLHQQLKVA